MMGIKKELFGVAEQSLAMNKEQQEQIEDLQNKLNATKKANAYLHERHSKWSADAIRWKSKCEALQAEVERLKPQSTRENLPYEADWRIQSLIHVPTLAVADRPSDAFVEFIESDLLENHHELVKAWPAIAEIEDAQPEDYASIFAEQCPFEFLAVVDFAINNNFRFNDQGEFQSCNCSWGYYRQVWLFANSMNELINKAITLSGEYFDQAEKEAKE